MIFTEIQASIIKLVFTNTIDYYEPFIFTREYCDSFMFTKDFSHKSLV